MKYNGLSDLTRRLSSRLLNTMVKPHLIGDAVTPTSSRASDTPQDHQHNHINHHIARVIVVYVLQNYSRSNALLLDNETKRLGLPRALYQFQAANLDEKKAIIFLRYPHQSTHRSHDTHQHPPRLTRLIEAVRQHPELDVHLVPVTIVWGREPDKEDSWVKLLFTDSWQTPSKFKQLVNIGIHGRETYIEFHAPQSLRHLVTSAQQRFPQVSAQTVVMNQLNQYLDSKRAAILGPDLSDRRNVVQKLIATSPVQQAIMQESIRDKVSLNVAEGRAIKYLNEIVSDYSYSTVRLIERALTTLWTKLYDGVEVHHFDTVRQLADQYELIYTPCHRSHIDYLLLSYVIYRRGLVVPHVAAGNNLNLPFFGQLLRGGGAFFIRRSFKDAPLYNVVFKEYLHAILENNTPVEYFIEGGRSRSGRLLPPKTGMLAMTVQSYLRSHDKPIVFLPIYFGYERMMEGNTYIGELQGKPKEAESVVGVLKTMRKIERIFGKVYVNFGEPIFLDDILAKHAPHIQLSSSQDALPAAASQAVNVAAHQIMEHINRAAVINPVSLLSLVLLATPKHTLDEQSCAQQLDIYRLLSQRVAYDDRTIITPLSGQDIISYGIKLKLINRIDHALGNMIAVSDQQAVLLTYFRNNILHLFILPSLIAALVEHNGQIAIHDLQQIILTLYPFLKAELFLKWQPHDIETIVNQYVQVLVELHLLTRQDNILISPAPNTASHKQLQVLSAPVKQSLERYFMVITLISQRGSGHLMRKHAEDLGYLLGQRLSVLYEFNSPEFFDRALFASFIQTLAQQAFIQIDAQDYIHFDHQLSDIARYAPLVLEEETLQMLGHITAFTDKELQHALEELAKKKKTKSTRSPK